MGSERKKDMKERKKLPEGSHQVMWEELMCLIYKEGRRNPAVNIIKAAGI
jgi:hypothetical protein